MRVLCLGLILPQIGAAGSMIFASSIVSLLPDPALLNLVTVGFALLSPVYGIAASQFNTWLERAQTKMRILDYCMGDHPANWLEYERNARYGVI